MPRRKRAIGVNDFLAKTFDLLDFQDEWLESFGQPERNFRALAYGDSGQGKTEFMVKLSKYLTNFGKVFYNTFEQGISSSMQKALIRQNMIEVNGKIIYGDKETFEEVYARMGRRNSPQFCILDSLDYMNLTADQYRQLVERYPHKSFIIIAWSTGKHPKTQAAKDIEYMVDVKIRVQEYKAYMRSRFGGNKAFVIWPEYWEEKKKANQADLEAKRTAPKTTGTVPSPPPPPPRPKQPALFETDTDVQEDFVPEESFVRTRNY